MTEDATARDRVRIVSVMEKSVVTEMAMSIMYLEVVAITEAFRWLKDTDYESATIVTDSMSTLEKVRRTMLYDEWKHLIRRSKLSGVVWIFCPWHAGVAGNE